MSRPIAVASGGYLTGIGRDLTSIAADGYLVAVVYHRDPDPQGGYVEDPFLEQLRREDEDLMLFLSAFMMEIACQR